LWWGTKPFLIGLSFCKKPCEPHRLREEPSAILPC
jgi:hypothetical protein